MEKIFNRTHYVPCTAIGSIFDGDENQRVNAISVWNEDDQFHDGDCVIFNWDLPENEEDAEQMMWQAGEDGDVDHDVDGCHVLFNVQ